MYMQHEMHVNRGLTIVKIEVSIQFILERNNLTGALHGLIHLSILTFSYGE
jgi:hypothetical protein